MIDHVVEGCQCAGKACTKCDEVKCLGAFSKDKRLRSGLKSRCKTCCQQESRVWHQAHIDHDAAYRLANRDRQRARGREYYHKHREKYREYRLAHAESVEEYKRRWWHENKEVDKVRRKARRKEINERRRILYQNNPELAKERSRAYKQAHPEHYREYARTHPEVIRVKTAHRRARKKNALGAYTVGEWEALKYRYGYSCLCCGRKEPDIKLTVDHVIPLIKGGINTIDNIQPLCFSCNSAKRTKIVDYRKDIPR